MKTITLNENEITLIKNALGDKAFETKQMIKRLSQYEDLKNNLEHYKNELKETEELLIKL